MFSGFVSRISLRSFGSSTGTVMRTTGTVIRKMISSTSMTSTSGVVLIVEIASSSSPSGDPTFIAMASPFARVDEAPHHALAGTLDDDSSTAWRSAPKPRTRSIAVLLRRMSQL